MYEFYLLEQKYIQLISNIIPSYSVCFYVVFVVHQFPSDNVWGDITMKLEGTGRVLLQLDAEVNVEYKEMQKMPKNPLDTEQVYRSFEIECTPGFLSRNNSIMIMTACGRWVGTTVNLINLHIIFML